MKPIYLDYNASTPVAPEVLEAMAPYSAGCYGNPHTLHWAGRPGGAAVERARGQVAAALGCAPGEVVFTSGASEANSLAIKGCWFANRRRGDHIITSAVEHGSVRNAVAWLAGAFGVRVTTVGVDRFGRVSAADVLAAIEPKTVLVSIMHANNEVGTIQPIEEIAGGCRARGVAVHCDAAQSFGKIPVTLAQLGVDYLTLAGHKFYAPKGVGALIVRSGAPALDPLIHGVGQERGLRGGTENVPYLVGFGAACELAAPLERAESLRRLCDRLWEGLHERLGARIQLLGHPEQRLPNTANIAFRGLSGAELLARIPEIAASPGAACNTGKTTLSATLTAMGVEPELGAGAIRWSMGRATTVEDVDTAIDLIARAARPAGA